MTLNLFSFDGYSYDHNCVFSVQFDIDRDNLGTRILRDITAYDTEGGVSVNIDDILGTTLELAVPSMKHIITLHIPENRDDFEKTKIAIEPMVEDRLIKMRDLRTNLVFDVMLNNRGQVRYATLMKTKDNKTNENFPYQWNEKEKEWVFKPGKSFFFVNKTFEGPDIKTGDMYQVTYGTNGAKYRPEAEKMTNITSIKDVVPVDADPLFVTEDEDISLRLERLIEETRAMPAMGDKMHIIDSMVATIRNRKADMILNGTTERKNSIHSLLGPVVQDFGHMAFLGNPGTLKTVFAEILHLAMRAEGFLTGPMITVNGQEVIKGYVGKSAEYMRGKIEEAIASNGLLFVDEFHTLNDTGGDQKSSQFGAQAARELIAAMENNRDKFVVVLAGYPEEMIAAIKDIDPGLKDRISQTYILDDYSPDELEEIFYYLMPDDYTLAKGVREIVRQKIDEAYEVKDKTFSNGRLMRGFVASVVKAQIARTDTINRELIKRDKEGTLTYQFKTAARRKKLMITLDDVIDVNLNKLDQKENVTNPIGFDFGFAPVNDDAPPAPKRRERQKEHKL